MKTHTLDRTDPYVVALRSAGIPDDRIAARLTADALDRAEREGRISASTRPIWEKAARSSSHAAFRSLLNSIPALKTRKK